MSAVVFVDTFYWVALVNRLDVSHQKTIDFARSYSGQSVTTEWILTEVADGFSRPQHRPRLQQLRQLWQTDQRLTIVEANHELFERGLDYFCNRLDKSWSLTGCISFVVMKDKGISEALTADHHFEQAGFVPLLK